MATFPTLTPSGRTFTPGEYPHTPFTALSGWQNRVRHSNVMLASQIRLRFTAVTEANMLSILSHYQGQLGTFDSFDLPSTVWAGTTPSDYQLTNYLWRYIQPPTVDDVYCDRYNVELTLETVPPDGAVVDGMYGLVTVTLTAIGAAAASGLNKTVTASFNPGRVVFSGADFTVNTSIAAANGIATTVTSTLAAGTPTAEASVSGLVLTVTASFTGGTATGGGIAADYWSDMSVQLYGWESLAYIEWWGN